MCTINEGDPYVAVVRSACLTRHLGGAVHMLVFAFIHGVTTSMVWRAQVTSDDVHPCLTIAVSPSSTSIPCGRGARGEGGDHGFGSPSLGGWQCWW